MKKPRQITDEVLKKVDPDKVWSLVTKTKSCWLWRGGKGHHNGYGLYSIAGIPYRLTRLVYAMTYGPIEDASLYVLHKCDNPPCVNPKHLYLGSQKDNQRDVIDRHKRVPSIFRKKTLFHKFIKIKCHNGHDFQKYGRKVLRGVPYRYCSLCND